MTLPRKGSWFRFSYISAASVGADDESPDGEDDATENSTIADKYSERESAFFLQASADTSVTLVCFGAGSRVKRRMYDLMKSRGWSDVATNPQILFDVALEGLHEEVDDTARKIEEEFEPLEKSIIQLAGSEVSSHTLSLNPATTLSPSETNRRRYYSSIKLGITTTIRSSHTGSSFDEAHRGFDPDILAHNHRRDDRRIRATAIGTIRRRRLMGRQRNTVILSAVVYFDTVDTRVGFLVTLLVVVEARQERQDVTTIFMASKGNDMEKIHEREEGTR
ncbi:hypothetical protein Trihar35433_4772 [Trichoderma harzianum]|nr:hypothetical protein Trihar35433_4772 [Trichoderma harzianum]